MTPYRSPAATREGANLRCVMCGSELTAARIRIFERAKADYKLTADRWEIADVATCSADCGRERKSRRMTELAAMRRRDSALTGRREGT